MKTLQILGPGCPKCKTLADRVDTVARDLGLDYCLTKVTDVLESQASDVGFVFDLLSTTDALFPEEASHSPANDVRHRTVPSTSRKNNSSSLSTTPAASSSANWGTGTSTR